MTKYALLGLLRTLSVEYEKKGIMINGISPGMMETKFLDGISRLVVEKFADFGVEKESIWKGASELYKREDRILRSGSCKP